MKRILCILLVSLLYITAGFASTFRLNLEVTPQGSGSLNTSGGIYEQGTVVYLRTYNYTGFIFKGWYDGEELVSSATGFNYTVPERDVSLQAKYEYDPSVPGNPAMPDTTTYYKLSASVSPMGSGSVNITEGRYATNASVNMRTNYNTGYRFIGWQNEAGSIVSTSSSFYYYMPNHESSLTALYEFDPSAPANPDSMATKYTVNLKCKPVGGGTFNTSATTLAEGSSVYLYAYTNTGYRFKHWEDESGKVISSDRNFYYVIPHGNSTIYGVYEFDPDLPANPNKNYWNKETGELIIDDFTTGSLVSAASSAISGSTSSVVTMITVVGRMNSNDFGIANSYTNCTLLDISRIAGVTELPSYAFDETRLISVYLPASIEKINDRAFYNCTQLSSITLYSMTPPALGSNVFTNTPEGLVVYVPAVSLNQYQEAEGWKEFTIMPIQDDIRNITIDLPENITGSDFRGLWLELTNTKSGQRLHYIMTDRQSYSFPNIIRNTSWNIQIRNERGDLFGQINNVEVKDEDVTVAFDSLSKPQTVTLSVLTPEGTNVTGQTQIAWMDANGNYLAQSASTKGMCAGKILSYRVTLSQGLATAYVTPGQTNYTVLESGNNVVCTLAPIDKIKLSGKVTDVSTRGPLNGVMISITQTFLGKYSKTISTKTDAQGSYSLSVYKVPTTLSFAASDYVSQTVGCDSLVNGGSELKMKSVALKPITGATIAINFTYRPSVAPGELPVVQGWYSEYNNIGYTIYNKTKQRAINQFSVQYPKIVLLEEVDEKDELILTAKSVTSAFLTIKDTVKIDAEQHASATFDIVGLGGIKASFNTTGNTAVVGSLYNGSGKLVKSYDYVKSALVVNNLSDGMYTLVTMGSSKLFNSIYDLSQLPNTGLILGTDYLQNTVEVKSGVVSKITIEEVPKLDESKLYYTGSNTSFTINKSSVVVGNYLTLTGSIDFKSVYAGQVSNVQLVVDLPESCSFVDNSVMVGNSTNSYSLNGSQIIIPMENYRNRVRFCVIPTQGGSYTPSAFVQFTINGKRVSQPIGTAYYSARDLSIMVPSAVAKKKFVVSGVATDRSSVKLYDDEKLLGNTTALANGVWSMECDLGDCYNRSYHNIYAKVTTPKGLSMTSEVQTCFYDMNCIEVSKVTMLNTAHTASNLTLYEYTTVFDFLNPSSKSPVYWYWPSYPKFTFLVDFTNNDPEIVENVHVHVLMTDNNVRTIPATFNKSLKKWIASDDFNNGTLPMNCSVTWDSNTEFVVDSRELEHLDIDIDSLIDGYWESRNQTQVEDTVIIDDIDLEDESFMALFDSLSADELYLYMDSIQMSYELESDSLFASIDSLFSPFAEDFVSDDGVSIEYLEYVYKTSVEWEAEGFEAISSTDSSRVYRKIDGLSVYIVDDSAKSFIKVNYVDLLSDEATPSQVASRISSADYKDLLLGFEDKVREGLSKIQSLYSKIESNFDVLAAKILANTTQAEEVIKKHSVFIEQENIRIKNLMELQKSANPTQFEELARRIEKAQTRIGIATDLIADNNLKLKQAQGALKDVKYLKGWVGKALPILKYISLGDKAISNMREVKGLIDNIPSPETCKCADGKSAVSSVETEALAFFTAETAYLGAVFGWEIANDLANVAVVTTTNVASVPIVTVKQIVKEMLIDTAKDLVHDGLFYWEKGRLRKSIENARAECMRTDCEEGGEGGDDSGGGGVSWGSNGDPYGNSGNANSEYVQDPSGYVYEAVSTNRVEGVTATAYYKETVEDMYGDFHENIVIWDAEEYAQENPLFTDENGMYAWDVPEGLWQVKFEKNGYETTYSEWLPVPPPQLDVNIPIKQNVQPNVKAAHAYEGAVELEFDKYMMPELLTTDNIIVQSDGVTVEGTVQLLNEEVRYEGNSETFASKIRFNAAQPFAAGEVTLRVSNRVKSYAGVRMQDDYLQAFTIEKEISKIVCDSSMIVIYGDTSIVPVAVMPADASEGKTLKVQTSSSMILSLKENELLIDEEGKAYIRVIGELPGTSAISFTVEGSKLNASTIVNVLNREAIMVAEPRANIASGTEVEIGTKVYLYCETAGSTIYYTTDGTCPCDMANAIVYDGTPIVINEAVTIKVVAGKQDMFDSEMVAFSYSLAVPVGVEDVIENNSLKIYPTPIKSSITISVGGETIKGVSIISLTGATVISKFESVKEIQLDVHSLVPGIYVLRVTTDKRSYYRKIVKVE